MLLDSSNHVLKRHTAGHAARPFPTWFQPLHGHRLPSASYSIAALLRLHSHTTQMTHSKCPIRWSLAYTQSCTTITTNNFRTFRHPERKTQNCFLPRQPLIYRCLCRGAFSGHATGGAFSGHVTAMGWITQHASSFAQHHVSSVCPCHSTQSASLL